MSCARRRVRGRCWVEERRALPTTEGGHGCRGGCPARISGSLRISRWPVYLRNKPGRSADAPRGLRSGTQWWCFLGAEKCGRSVAERKTPAGILGAREAEAKLPSPLKLTKSPRQDAPQSTARGAACTPKSACCLCSHPYCGLRLSSAKLVETRGR